MPEPTSTPTTGAPRGPRAAAATADRSRVLALRLALRLALGLALVAAVAFAFWPLGGNSFVGLWDDEYYIAGNARVRAGLTWAGVRWALTSFSQANWHPLTWLSHMVDVSLFGMDPRGHHLVSLALHLANALLLLRLLRGLTGSAAPSAAAAALFAVHPLRVEVVAWASERKELLSVLFGLLALEAYRRYCARPSPRRMVPVVAAYALGLSAKPIIVTLPFALLLLDYWPLGRGPGSPAPERSRRSPGALWLEKLPLLVLAGASGVVTYLAQRAGGALDVLHRPDAGVRIASAVVSYVRYLGMTAWPADLAFFYPHGERMPPTAGLLGSAALLAAVTAVVWLGRRRRPALLTGWLWFVGTLVPVIGVVQVGWQALADRYTYLPHVGLFAAAAWETAAGAGGLGPRLRGLAPLAAGGAAALAVAVLAAGTRAQVRTWRDPETLCRHALGATQRNWLAHQSLGYVLSQQGRQDEALRHSLAAAEIKPDEANNWNNLGCVLQARRELPAAAAAFREAARLRPLNPEFHKNLGWVAVSLGDADEAVAAFSEALRLEPGSDSRRRELEFARGMQLRRRAPASGGAPGREPEAREGAP